MKKIFAIAAALLLLVQAGSAMEFSGSFAEARAQAGKLGKPLLIDFFTEW